MKKEFFLALLICLTVQRFLIAQIADPKASEKWAPELTEVWEPAPPVVTPGAGTSAPSDAIILFDGKNANEWTHQDGSPIKWEVKDGVMTVAKGSGAIFTKKTFGDCQLHLEWRSPAEAKGQGQDRGNSGVFFQNRYEVQVLDNYNSRTYSNGQAASIYKQSMPLVNACRPPGEWQTYDIIFTAPRFNNDGIKTNPGYLTVIHNGIVVQNHVEIKGTTVYRGLPQNEPHGQGPIQLQDHDHPVSFRNIWIREL